VSCSKEINQITNGSKIKLQVKEFVTECKSTNMRMSMPRKHLVEEKR
jgi:hypothetical protein